MSDKGYRTRLNELRLARAAKMKHDITYQDIANHTGLAYMTVHRYATKNIARPDFETLAKLAGYFGVAVEDLIYPVDNNTVDESPGQRVGVGTA